MNELVEKEKMDSEKQKEIITNQIQELNQTISSLQTELATRIPVDVDELAVKLGLSQSLDEA